MSVRDKVDELKKCVLTLEMRLDRVERRLATPSDFAERVGNLEHQQRCAHRGQKMAVVRHVCDERRLACLTCGWSYTVSIHQTPTLAEAGLIKAVEQANTKGKTT